MTLQQEGPNLWNKHSKIGWSQVGCCTIMDDNPLCNIISKNLCLRDKISPVTLVKSKWLASHGFSPFPTTNILMSGIIPVSCLCLLSSLWLTKGCHMLQGCVGGLVKGVEWARLFDCIVFLEILSRLDLILLKYCKSPIRNHLNILVTWKECPYQPPLKVASGEVAGVRTD